MNLEYVDSFFQTRFYSLASGTGLERGLGKGRGRVGVKTILTTPTPIFAKICPLKLPYNVGPYGIEVPQNQGISTEKFGIWTQ